eukprot:c15927_g1_i1 orf=16-258(+)
MRRSLQVPLGSLRNPYYSIRKLFSNFSLPAPWMEEELEVQMDVAAKILEPGRTQIQKGSVRTGRRVYAACEMEGVRWVGG